MNLYKHSAVHRFLKAFISIVFFGLTMATFAQAQTVRLGQIVPLTGPLANVGLEISTVTQATFAQYNATNPIVKIELAVEDDGNSPERSGAAVAILAPKTIGLLSCFGTVGCIAQMNAAERFKLPLLAPIAGAQLLRDDKAKYVFAVRAGAKEELSRLLKFSETVNFKQLAVAVQDDGFGQNYLVVLKALLQGSDIKIKELVMLKPSNPDYAAAAVALQKSPTQALLLLVNASNSVGILNALKAKKVQPFVLNLPGQANALYAKGLQGYTGGASFSTVTPSPWETKLQIQRDYHATMAAAQITNFSYLGFESYINARIAIEAIKQNRALTAASFSASLDNTSYKISDWYWKNGDPATTKFTDLALLRPDGTFKH